MDKCKEHLDSDISNARDPKEGVVALDSISLGSDQIDADKTVEDKNRNITLLKSKGNIVAEGKQTSTSSSKDKANVVGLYVGPNGLINGLEIENSASLSHLWEHIPKTEIHQSFYKPSSSHNAKTCEGSSEQSLMDLSRLSNSNDKRTDLSLESNCKATYSEQSSSSASCAIPDIARHSAISETRCQVPTRPDAECDVKRNQEGEVEYVSYMSELQMPDIMRLIQNDLSEPYSIYTYRYFIHNWPKLCFLAMDGKQCVGAIVCKLDIHRKVVKRGYIAMLAVDEKYRKKKIGSNLVLKAIRAMVADDADEVVLETEITNQPALRLYENLGFVRDKRLFRYYLNGVDALRLKLWLR